MPNLIWSFRFATRRLCRARSSLLIVVSSILILVVSVSLQLTRAQQPSPSQTSKSAPAKPEEDKPLEPGRSIDRKLAGGQAHSFLVSVAARQFVRVIAEQQGIDLVLALYDGSGKKLVETDRPNGSYGPEELLWVVETGANLRLEARALDEKAAEGNYRIRLEERRAAEPLDRKRLAAQQEVSEGNRMREQRKEETRRQAVKHFEAAAQLWREAGSMDNEAFAQILLGWTWSELGEKEKAGEVLRESLALWEKAGNRQGQAIVLHNLGNDYAAGKDLRKALEHYERAGYAAAESGDQESVRRIAEQIKRHCDKQKGQAAVFCRRQLLELQRQMNDQEGIAESLLALGNLLYLAEEMSQALEYYEEALPLLRAAEDRGREATTLNNIGVVWSKLGEKRKALEYYEQALPLRRAARDRGGEAATLNNIGWVWSELGEMRQALEYYEQALPLLRAAEDRGGEATTLNNIGAVWSKLGEKRKALEYYEQALPLRRAAGDRGGEAATLNNMMHVLEKDNPRLAIHFGKQSVNHYQQLRSNIQTLDESVQQTFLKSIEFTYRKLSELLIAQGRIAEAERMQEMLKDEEYFKYSRRDPKVASALSRRADLTEFEAKALAEYARLGDQLTAVGAELMQLEDLRRRLPETAEFPQQARLNELKTQLASATRAFQVFQRQLAEEFGKTNVRVKEIESGLQADLRNWGLKGTVVITTIAGEERLHLIVTTPSAQEAHTIEIKAADLNKLVAEFREAVTNPCACLDPRPAGRKLYELLIKPLEQDLKGAQARTLLWSLDGTLRYLPIAALWDGKRYLAERYDNVVITLASRTKMAVAPQPVGQWRGLGVGVSKQWGDFPSLPAVPSELRSIIRQEDEPAKKNGEAGVLLGRRLLDAEFTRERFERALGRYSVIHVASHFSFEPGKERSSYLLLGDGGAYTLDAVSVSTPIFSGVELLTLSACNTGMGSGGDGSEVEGFGELAQEKGALAVLATLWAVADESTARLMWEFYRIRVTKPNLTKAEALRQAQLALLRGVAKAGGASGRKRSEIVEEIKGGKFPEYKADSEKPYAHPYYWAPFILIGNWR